MIQMVLAILGIGLALVGIGIGILTTDKLSSFPLMNDPRRIYIGWTILILGFVTCSASVIASIFRLITRASLGFQEVISPKLLERFEYEFDDEYCEPEKIREVLRLSDSILERFSHVDENFLMQKHRINSEIIRCVRKKKTGIKYLSGYYILYPINEECEKLIEQGYIQGSRMIRDEHICTGIEEASSIYVSMVYGRDMPTRGFIVYLLKRDMQKILKRNNKLKYVYASPASSEGFLLAKKFGLIKMPSNADIWRYDLKER